MDFINLKSLNLTVEESEDLIRFLAQKRGITTKKLLSTIKLNLKHKNNKDLASKSQQKSIRTQQKLAKQTKSQRELIKSQRKLKQTIRINKITTKINKIYKNTTKINKTNKITKRIN